MEWVKVGVAPAREAPPGPEARSIRWEVASFALAAAAFVVGMAGRASLDRVLVEPYCRLLEEVEALFPSFLGEERSDGAAVEVDAGGGEGDL